ncbi:MAG TPA: serine hydrolase [Xanthobacteraceae bacterium]|nr:serine hydrolase [Xanthobacteraceae bacterium]
MLARRRLLEGSGALLAAAGLASRNAAADWTSINPGEAGFPDDLGVRIDRYVLPGKNIHGIVVVRRGRMVLERYYEGEDQVRIEGGRTRTERVSFNAERSHELRSVTKSIVGLLYGIALGEGRVPPPDAPLLAQFPQYGDLPDLAQRQRWTIAHALTMTLGMDWNEELSYEDPRNGQTAMEAAPDRYRYALAQPIVAVAGERWIYSGGATVLIGKIIEKGVGGSVHDYARAALFDPLGIGPTEWRIGRDGEMNFASGLAMRPHDLARVGELVLDGGKVGERQVVPADWLEASFKPAARISDRLQYGYHWYLSNVVRAARQRGRFLAAFGNGGQRLFAFPELALVVVVTAGNYNRHDRLSDDLVNEVVLASLL